MRWDSEERERERRRRGSLSRIKWQTARSLESLFLNSPFSLSACFFCPPGARRDPQALILWKWNIPSLISGPREKRRGGKRVKYKDTWKERGREGGRERAWRASKEHTCPSEPRQTRESVSAFSRQFFTREHAPVSDSRPPSLTTHRLHRSVRDLSSSMIENHRRRTMSTAEPNLEIPSYINMYIATNFLTNA